MPVKVNPDQFYQLWRQKLDASADRIRIGVQALTENPCEKASRMQDKWLAGIQQAVATGKWASNLRAVTLDQWKNAMLNKGIPRIPQGTASAEPIVKDFARKLIEHMNTRVLPEVERLPKLTLEDSINRVTTFIRRMAEFKYIRG
ncbi:MAG: hypothetical protein QXY94_02520 [Archaeoglobaceae archaeon]